MLRLTVLKQTRAKAVLKVEGRVTEDTIGLLAQEGARLLADSQRLVLELAGVEFVDAAGIELLKQWAGPRLVVRDGPAFVRRLLEQHGLPCEEGGDDSG